jgi:hypothetical protein
VLAHVQFPVFWFPDWGGDVIGPDEALVAENAVAYYLARGVASFLSILEIYSINSNDRGFA